MSSDLEKIFITFEYPDDIDDREIDKWPPFNITLKSNGKMTTYDYQGAFVVMLIQQAINNLFAVVDIIDQFGFVEFDKED